MVRYTAADYLYITARVRALEQGLIGKEKLEGLLAARDADSTAEALVSLGLPRIARADGTLDAEAMCTAWLKAGYDTVAEAVPGSPVLTVLRIPYDCNNIKAILKARARGVGTEGLLSPLGNIPPDVLKNALLEGGVPEGLTPALAAAVTAAAEVLAKTGDPQEAELVLDRAAFADMVTATAGVPFLAEGVAMRADLTNICSFLRLAAMQGPFREGLLERALLPGGRLAAEVFTKAFFGGVKSLKESLKLTPYAGILTGDAPDAAEASRRGDALYLARIQAAKSIPFGPEVPFGYLTGMEIAVKNLRILLAGRRAHTPVDEIRRKWRGSYV